MTDPGWPYPWLPTEMGPAKKIAFTVGKVRLRVIPLPTLAPGRPPQYHANCLTCDRVLSQATGDLHTVIATHLASEHPDTSRARFTN